MFSRQAEVIARKARQMQVDAILVGSDGWDRHLFATMPPFEAAFMTAHYSDRIITDKNQEFVKYYREEFDMSPGDTAALTYDALHLVFASIRLQDSADPESIREGLYKLPPYEGVTGTIDFVNNGDPVKGVAILQFKDGEVKFVGFVSGD